MKCIRVKEISNPQVSTVEDLLVKWAHSFLNLISNYLVIIRTAPTKNLLPLFPFLPEKRTLGSVNGWGF